MERYEGVQIDDLTPNGPYVHVTLHRSPEGYLFFRTPNYDTPTTMQEWEGMKFRRHGKIA